MNEDDTNVDLDDKIENDLSFREGFDIIVKKLLRKLVLFISFGPGVLGVFWVIGRLLRR